MVGTTSPLTPYLAQASSYSHTFKDSGRAFYPLRFNVDTGSSASTTTTRSLSAIKSSCYPIAYAVSWCRSNRPNSCCASK